MPLAYYRSSADAFVLAAGVASMHARRPGWPDNPETGEHVPPAVSGLLRQQAMRQIDRELRQLD